MDGLADDQVSSPPPRPSGLGAVGALLWLAFVGVVLFGGWLFLQACGFDAIGLDFCPVRADLGEARREVAIGDDLARQVQMAQLAVAGAPVCAPPAPPPVRTAPLPPATPRPSPTDAIDKAVVDRGGHNGTLQFTLSWSTRDDLDLNVECPGGRIDSQPGRAGPGICGDGRKDIDANRNLTDNVSLTPIENMVWQTDIPQGRYQIEVIEYRAATSLGNTVPFTLRVRWNGEERVCRDSVSTTPMSPQQIAANGRVIGGSERLLTFTLEDGLPDCSFVVADTYRSAPSK